MLILVSLAASVLIELVPGDPAREVVGPDATPEQYEQARQELGLDRPWAVRYFEWLGGLFTGNLGKTLVPPVQEVSTLVANRLPVTIEIAVLAVFLALVIAIPVGVWSAYRFDKSFDRVASAASFALISLPNFLLALFVIYAAVYRPELLKLAIGALGAVVVTTLVVTALRAGPSRARRQRLWTAGVVVVVCVLLVLFMPEFPRQGFAPIAREGLLENLRTVALPVLVLGLAESAQLIRLLRNDMSATLREDFVLAARAQGMPVRHILVKQALRPSTFSLITVAGISFGRLLGGTVIVETIFRLPGMGTLIVDSVNKKEFMVLQVSVLLIATLYVVINAVIDLLYVYLDPRTRHAHV